MDKEGDLAELPLEAIVPNPHQPRVAFDDEAIRELSESIREVVLLQPVIVRELADGRYELIAGERRLRASRLAELERIPAVVRSVGEQASLELALIENIQRQDIGPIECARAYRRLMTEFSLTQDQVARKVGKSRVAIANTLRLLRLPARIQSGLQSNVISEGHARAILAFDREDHQLAVYDQVICKGLSVREVEDLAHRKPKSEPAAKPLGKWSDAEDELAQRLQAPVRIQASGEGGKIVIEFFSEEELLGIVDRIGGA